MNPNLILLAIPLFFLLILVEFLWSRARGADIYRFDDSIADLGCGITQQVAAAFFKLVMIAGYAVVFEQFGLLTMDPKSPWTWAFAFVAVDFIYYWWHRASHRINFMWAAHIVHHQSDEYNLSVALRQAMFTQLTSFPMFLPLAFLGVPTLVLFVCVALNTLYQFWIHTRLIGKLGPVELLMNTPSHHRVHHGINPEYIDKNYAGVFITWDRLFGTFVEERAEVRYGIVEQFRSWNPLWANFHYYPEIVRKASKARGLQQKLWAWFAPPEWSAGGIPAAPANLSRPAFETSPGKQIRVYVGLQFAVMVAATLYLLANFDAFSWSVRASLAAWIVLTAYTLGALLEGRSLRWVFEGARLAILTGVAGWLLLAN